MTTPTGDAVAPPTPANDPIANYVHRYVPTTLIDEQWQRLGQEVRALTLRSEPVSASDAKNFMGTLCAFLAWCERKYGQQPLAAAVTAGRVGRHIHDLEGQIGDCARGNAQCRLKRVLRVLAGEPARTKRRPRSASAAPFEEWEMTALANAAEHEAALRTVLAALGRRQPASAGQGPAAYTPPCPSSWAEARRAAAAVGVHLTLDRVRLTWVVRQLSTDGPLASSLARTTLTRADLQNATDHLHVTDQEAYRTQLRQ